MKAIERGATIPKVITFPALVFHRPRPRKLPRKDKTKPYLVIDAIKNIDDVWNTAKRKAELAPCLHFHDLRRTFRTHMKKAHVDSFTLNEIMGHSNPPIEATYTQIDNAQLVEAISRFLKWHKSGAPEAGRETRPEGQYPQALALTGVEGGT